MDIIYLCGGAEAPHCISQTLLCSRSRGFGSFVQEAFGGVKGGCVDCSEVESGVEKGICFGSAEAVLGKFCSLLGECGGIFWRYPEQACGIVERLIVGAVQEFAVLSERFAMVGNKDDYGVAVGDQLYQLRQEIVGGDDGIIVGIDYLLQAQGAELLAVGIGEE